MSAPAPFENSLLARQWREGLDPTLADLPARIRADAIDAPSLFRFLHDLTALAPAFGYGLAGKIASHVVERLRGAEGPLTGEQRSAALAAQAALTYVLSKEIKGDGGAAGAAILAKLDQIVGGSA
jgi:hypothetical protein